MAERLEEIRARYERSQEVRGGYVGLHSEYMVPAVAIDDVAWLLAELGRYETLAVEMERELDEALSAEPFPTLAWIYHCDDLTEDWQGWRRPVSLGTDIQSGRDWRTVMIRVPGRRYLLLRLWPMRGEE